MQFFLANMYSERLSGSTDTAATTPTSDPARTSSGTPVLSGSR